MPSSESTPRSRREALRQRQAALERFSRWERDHPVWPTPQAALSAVGLLYELLPAEEGHQHQSRNLGTAGKGPAGVYWRT